MRTIVISVLLLVASSCINRLSAQDYKLAMGVRFSSASPTLSNSFSVKYFMDETNAIEGLISFGTRFGIGGLYERHQLIGGTPAFTWFWGLGGYVGWQDNNTFLGPTGAIGLDYKFANAPLNLSIDWKPELDILPNINFVPDAFGITARYTFGR
ncbi:MAG TPA: hypothetical protein VHE34_21355 [Puia sp.]|uniref:hypothetical protein n=1 Tax=Puia sp. TaxID=2045100 RepID=UPI002CE2DFFA|nr:hypothetical protein [Puia sp.]HVU97791.1 hypothetical protein [Puia sp.]